MRFNLVEGNVFIGGFNYELDKMNTEYYKMKDEGNSSLEYVKKYSTLGSILFPKK